MSFKSGVKSRGSDRCWEWRWWLWWGVMLICIGILHTSTRRSTRRSSACCQCTARVQRVTGHLDYCKSLHWRISWL